MITRPFLTLSRDGCSHSVQLPDPESALGVPSSNPRLEMQEILSSPQEFPMNREGHTELPTYVLATGLGNLSNNTLYCEDLAQYSEAESNGANRVEMRTSLQCLRWLIYREKWQLQIFFEVQYIC